MLKDFFAKKLIESKMKDVPKEQRDAVIGMVEKNPALFKKIADEVQSEIKGGKDQMAATMSVMSKYQNELRTITDK